MKYVYNQGSRNIYWLTCQLFFVIFLKFLGIKNSSSLWQKTTEMMLNWMALINSFRKNISIHPMLLFIQASITTATKLLYFNTSHVTVYRFTSFLLLSKYTDFNTSHVTVYPTVVRGCAKTRRISIHPMLLFILSPPCLF